MQASGSIKSWIKSQEGLRLQPYVDGAGKYSIYYGHQILSGEVFNETEEDANIIFERDIKKYEAITSEAFKNVFLSQNEFDALFAFAYNVGGFGVPELESYVIDYKKGLKTAEQLKTQWLSHYITQNGIKLAALVKRRQYEYDLFMGDTSYAGAGWFLFIIALLALLKRYMS